VLRITWRDHKIFILAVVAFLVYLAWMMGPYLRSIIVRDAAVTAWARFAIAPIDGVISSDLPRVSSQVGDDGHMFSINNPLLFEETAAVTAAIFKLDMARVRRDELSAQVKEVEALQANRQRLKSAYAGAFKAEIQSEIENYERQAEVLGERIQILQRLIERQESLESVEALSEAVLDETKLRVSDLLQQEAQVIAQLKLARLRQQLASEGVYVSAEGDDPGWVRESEVTLRLESYELRHRLAEANVEVKDSEALLEVEEALLGRLTNAEVTAPPGSFIERVHTIPGTTVKAGDTILEWANCQQLLVDVPVSDAEVALLAPGMPAEVVMEGERAAREGVIEFLRGSSAIIGRESLVAVAKGRGTRKSAQAVVRLSTQASPGEACPIGRAAFVEFPDVGVIDVILARLRL